MFDLSEQSRHVLIDYEVVKIIVKSPSCAIWQHLVLQQIICLLDNFSFTRPCVNLD